MRRRTGPRAWRDELAAPAGCQLRSARGARATTAAGGATGTAAAGMAATGAAGAGTTAACAGAAAGGPPATAGLALPAAVAGPLAPLPGPALPAVPPLEPALAPPPVPALLPALPPALAPAPVAPTTAAPRPPASTRTTAARIFLEPIRLVIFLTFIAPRIGREWKLTRRSPRPRSTWRHGAVGTARDAPHRAGQPGMSGSTSCASATSDSCQPR